MFTPTIHLTLCLFIIFGSVTLTSADYNIDDHNSSIQYAPSIVITNSNSNLWWPLSFIPYNYLTDLNGSRMTFEYDRFYNQTM
jgi:hypothetical protein